MSPRSRTAPRLASFVFALVSTSMTSVGIAGCSASPGGYSGRYETTIEDGYVRLDFQGGSKVRVSLGAKGQKEELVHNCVFAISGNKMMITTDEPMGAPMTLLIDGANLKDESGTVFTKR